MKSLLAAIGRAIAAIFELVVIVISGAAHVVRRFLGISSPLPDLAAEAAAVVEDAGERGFDDRWDPEAATNRAMRCVTAIALGTKWPDVSGIPNALQGFLVKLTKEQALTLLSASRQAQEDHLTGRKAIAGLPAVPPAGRHNNGVPREVAEGTLPKTIIETPEHAKRREIYARAAQRAADETRAIRMRSERRRAARLNEIDIDDIEIDFKSAPPVN
jgi:hypothetical protein